MRRSLRVQRETMSLLGWLAGLALALAALGVYGMMSYLVARRTREIGVRMALGASRAGVARLVLRSGLGVAVAGLALGLPAAIGGAPLLRHGVFGVTAFDWRAFGISALLALLAVLLAPARRASKVDAMAALRAE
jgi:ABC-type antimicrobial peptide transport system permease subunit